MALGVRHTSVRQQDVHSFGQEIVSEPLECARNCAGTIWLLSQKGYNRGPLNFLQQTPQVGSLKNIYRYLYLFI